MPEMDAVDAETVGELLGNGVTKSDLAETQRTLERFRQASSDEFGAEQDWIRTALAAVTAANENYNTEVKHE